MPERGRRQSIWLALAGLAASVVALDVPAPGPAQPDAAARSSAAPGAVVLRMRGAVVRVALDGRAVAAAARGAAGACAEVVVRPTPTAPPRTFPTRLNCPDSFPAVAYFAELALGAGRVAWIEASGGHNLDLELRAAPVGGGRPSRLAVASNG